MFRDFLWLLHSKQSYDMQKANGLAGFVALVFVIVLMFKWNDWFAPLFFGLGLDKIPGFFNADHGDFYAMTFIHMLAWLFVILAVLIVIAVVAYLLFMTPLVFIWMIPLVIIPMLVLIAIDSVKNLFKEKPTKPTSPSRSTATPFVEVDKNTAMAVRVDALTKQGNAEKLSSSEATVYLNRATSITDEQPWLIGKDSKDNWYVLGNNPLPIHVSNTYNPYATSLYQTLRNIYAETKIARQKQGLVTTEDSWEHIAGSREMDDYFMKTYAKVEKPRILQNLCVAIIPLEVRMDAENTPYFHFEGNSEVVMHDDISDFRIFNVQTDEIKSLFKAIVREHSKFVETIHNLHVVFYTYPYFSEVEYSYLTEGGLGFFKAIESVKDAKKYHALYHPHVYTLALEEAHNFQAKWAINYLEGYQS